MYLSPRLPLSLCQLVCSVQPLCSPILCMCHLPVACLWLLVPICLVLSGLSSGLNFVCFCLLDFLNLIIRLLLFLDLDFDVDQMSSRLANAPHMTSYRNNFYLSWQQLQQSMCATWLRIWYLWGRDKVRQTSSVSLKKKKKNKKQKSKLTTIVFWIVTSCCHFVLTVCLCSPPSGALKQLWIRGS